MKCWQTQVYFHYSHRATQHVAFVRAEYRPKKKDLLGWKKKTKNGEKIDKIETKKWKRHKNVIKEEKILFWDKKHNFVDQKIDKKKI